MPPTIDRDTLAVLLTQATKGEIAGRYGITVKSVSRLIHQYELPKPRYVQTEATRQLRADAIRRAHQRDPSIVARKIRGLRVFHQSIRGKHLEDVLPREQAARLREEMRQRTTGVRQSADTREKRRRSMLGRQMSEDARQKISA